MVRRAKAFAFRSPFTMPELIRRLDGFVGRKWEGRDGDASSSAGDDRFRILFEQARDRFVLDLWFESEAQDAEVRWQALLALAQERILPHASATDVESQDPETPTAG